MRHNLRGEGKDGSTGHFGKAPVLIRVVEQLLQNRPDIVYDVIGIAAARVWPVNSLTDTHTLWYTT